MQIITAASLKGGSGKTSLAIFLSQALTHIGRRTLAIDLDHNNNLTDYFCRDADPEQLEAMNAHHVLTGKAQPAEAIRAYGLGLDVMPCTPSIAQADIELARDPMAYQLFKTRIRKLDYDIIIIDTPPSLSAPLTAALLAADLVLSPVNLTRWTVQGFFLLQQQIDRAAEASGEAPRLLAVPSIVTPAEAEKLAYIADWKSTRTAIPKNAAICNAGTNGTNLKESTKGWEAYNALAGEVME
jgi:chromosome partitioning protein